ncbi:hypothetical protein BRD10_00455 [Halobacteriales archaeon SW_12_71_31]|nr:MAG: hypothetical protein BRD10_00455 [Halobacteriales archaeon SW_12_71_31]
MRAARRRSVVSDPNPEGERRESEEPAATGSGPHAETAVSTGVDLLDAALQGGLPRERSTLLMGGPGTGKTTLAMNFLQAGLERGERCLFVSTEQTIAELRDSLASYEFDLDHDRLTYTSVHARPGRTIEEDETITLQTLSEEGSLDEGFAPPFETRYVRDHLERAAPCDRVVFDSVSGLSVLADDPRLFRREVLDLIRLLTDEFEATALFIAEETDPDDVMPLQFTTHGVVRLHRERVADDPHRFLTIEKMRGVDHDRRTVEIEFADAGVVARPERRSQPPALKQHRHAPVGIEGLDELTGGGLVRDGVLIEHDGRANLDALLSTVVAAALDRDETVTVVPTTGLTPARLGGLLDSHGYDLDDLIETGRLSVVDTVGGYDTALDNVFTAFASLDAVIDSFEETERRTDDGASLRLIDVASLTHRIGADDVRDLRYYLDSRIGPEDALVSVLNPDVVEKRVAAFHADSAEQVLRTWVTDAGLQYVALEKSPCGFVGSTSLMEYLRDPPYVAVQSPPSDRETPMSDG